MTQTGQKGSINWYDECKKLYESFGVELLNSLGLKMNNFDFERILSFRITNEINSTEAVDLCKFDF